MERFNYITPARVRVLVVPVGDVLAPDFARYRDKVAAVADIRLLDVAPVPECRYFNPQEFPQGRVFYTYVSADTEDAYLGDLEPFRKALLVVGIAVHDPTKTGPGSPEPLSAGSSAIARHTLVFRAPELLPSEEAVTHIPLSQDHTLTAVETAMCAVTHHFLRALDGYASSYANITLRLPTSLTDSNVLTRTITQAQKRLSSGLLFKAAFSLTLPAAAASPAKDTRHKQSQRQGGRQTKLLGNFFLLAGRAADALLYFTDAAINARKSDDHLWLASALDGLAVASTVLLYLGLPCTVQNPLLALVLQVKRPTRVTKSSADIRAASSSSPRSSTSSALSSSLPLFQNQASDASLADTLLVLAQRTSAYYNCTTADTDDCVPEIVYVESTLRNIKLMTTVYLAGDNATRSIVECLVTANPMAPLVPESRAILRKEIMLEIDTIFAWQIQHLDFAFQCRIYCCLASVYADLGLRRKEAFVLRILLVLLSQRVSKITENSVILESMSSLESIKSLFEILFSMYHIDTQTERCGQAAAEHYADWTTLQLLLLKVFLRVARALQDHETLAKLCVLTFTRFNHCLPQDDHLKLKQTLDEMNLLKIEVPYADPFLVRGVRFVAAADVLNHDTQGKKQDMSVHFSFDKSASKTVENVVCVNDVNKLICVLQNPFLHDLRIHEIHPIACDGFRLEAVASQTKIASYTPFSGSSFPPVRSIKTKDQIEPTSALTIPPQTFAEVVLPFKALDVGVFEITGLQIRAGYGCKQFYHIVDLEKVNLSRKLRYVTPKPQKTLDTLMQILLDNSVAERAAVKTLALRSIPSQPKLITLENSVVTGYLLLLEGEVQHHHFTLKNTSSDVVDYLSFSFWDSTIDSINARINQSAHYNSGTAEEMFELEWQLLRYRALTVTNKTEIASEHKVIQPSNEVKIEYDILGKRGMTELKLILEYGKKNPDILTELLIKNVTIPIKTTVHRSLDVIGSELLPFLPSTIQEYQEPKAEDAVDNLTKLFQFMSIIKTEDDDVSNFCLLALDLKNCWKDRLKAHVVSEIEGHGEFVVNEIINPNESIRLLLPVRRLSHDLIYPTKPIPSLCNKQYIKNYNVSEEEDNQIRLNYWARCGVLDKLLGRWETVGPSPERTGTIDLRRLRFTSNMTRVLIYDTILIYQDVYDGSKVMDKPSNTLALSKEKLYVLKTRIMNHSDKPVTGIFSHVPYPKSGLRQDTSIEQRILFNGTLQAHLYGEVIEGGALLELELEFLVLEKGQYEWGGMFEIAGQKQVVVRDPLLLVVS